MIPYGRHHITDEDIKAVVEVLKSDWLTTGPTIDQFEAALAEETGAKHAVVFSSGTAALHAAMNAAGIRNGDQAILPPITFAATANSVLYQGGTPVFADVDPGTLLIDPDAVIEEIRDQTKAIVAVDYAGQPCDYDALRNICELHGLTLVADACHSLGGSFNGKPVGSLADLNVFSFHPVKAIACGEGGAVTTDNARYARQMRVFRNHGISTEVRDRQGWYYEMISLGYNYRLSDIHAALGLSQLKRLRKSILRRSEIAEAYGDAFAPRDEIRPLRIDERASHAHHLYVVRVKDRDRVFEEMRRAEIGVNAHYIPVHLHPYYRRVLGTKAGLCPVAEAAYSEILSLPIYPTLKNSEVKTVIERLVASCGS